jgi:ribosomal protein S18 acetylase RimI-like enzyme
MLVRSIRRSDRPHIAALQIDSWRDSYTEALPETYLTGQLAEDLEHHWHKVQIQPQDIVLVAEEKGIIGFIAVWCRPHPYIDNFHVKPSKRSKGVGSRLMASAARHIIRQGHQTAYLWVVESNTQAIQFYERLGGVCTAHALKKLFGHKVPSVKIVWSDISVLCTIG